MQATDPSGPAPWALPRRIAFRFAALYLVAYALVDGNTAGFPLFRD